MRKPPLTPPPAAPLERELWLGHAAGYALVRDIRDYARGEMASDLTAEARAAALKAIDDALYGVMMVLDGVPEPLENDTHRVALAARHVLYERRQGEWLEVLSPQPEGWCMGYHGWIEGDYGAYPPVAEESDRA